MSQAFYCCYCGQAHSAPPTSWPFKCQGCQREQYRNPTPVAVGLFPIVLESGSLGLLTVRRGIPPKIGHLALPGGFINFGESWQQGCARELLEETGLAVDPVRLKLWDVCSVPASVLIFAEAPPLTFAQYQAAKIDPLETQELVVLESPQELAFASHTEMAERFFQRNA
jgi:ADP-ribose pyrophosphatase YjhB (NUDIX family)